MGRTPLSESDIPPPLAFEAVVSGRLKWWPTLVFYLRRWCMLFLGTNLLGPGASFITSAVPWLIDPLHTLTRPVNGQMVPLLLFGL